MEKRWRNLVILVLAILIIAGIYFVFSGRDEMQIFENQFNELKASFEEKGTTTDGKIDLQKINLLSKEDLTFLKSSTSVFKERTPADNSRSSKALVLISDVYYNYIEVVELDRKASSEAIIEDLKDVCKSIASFESAKDSLEQLIEKEALFESNAEEFLTKYSEENKTVGLLFQPKTQEEKDAVQLSFTEFEEYLNEVKSDCGANLAGEITPITGGEEKISFIAPILGIPILYWIIGGGAAAVATTVIGLVWTPTGGTAVASLEQAIDPVLEWNNGITFDCDESTQHPQRNLWIKNDFSLDWPDKKVSDNILNVRCDDYDPPGSILWLRGGTWAKYTVGGRIVEACNYQPRTVTVNYGSDYAVEFPGCVKFTFIGPNAERWISGGDDTALDGFKMEIDRRVMKALKLAARFEASKNNILANIGEKAIIEQVSALPDTGVWGDFWYSLNPQDVRDLQNVIGKTNEAEVYVFLSQEGRFTIEGPAGSLTPAVGKDDRGKYYFKFEKVIPGNYKFIFDFKDRSGNDIKKETNREITRARLRNLTEVVS